METMSLGVELDIQLPQEFYLNHRQFTFSLQIVFEGYILRNKNLSTGGLQGENIALTRASGPEVVRKKPRTHDDIIIIVQ